MDIKNMFSKKRLVFLVIFLAAAFIANRINFSALVGAENQYFTLFQFFGPIAGAFLGTIFGVVAVLGAQIMDYLILGKAFTLINVVRLLPMLFAIYYFANYSKKENMGKIFMVLVPLAAIILFVTHPIGKGAWYFSMYWLIPILGVMLPKWMPGKLFFRSLGATFTSHAIGSVAWLYTVPMTAEQWTGLIPVVAYERFIFAAGIAVSYVMVNTALTFVVDKAKLPLGTISVDKGYILSKRLFRVTP